MNAFAAAVDAIYRDPNVAVDAVYCFADGRPNAPVRIVLGRPRRQINLADLRAPQVDFSFTVRASEVDEPKAGDVAQVSSGGFAGRAFKVRRALPDTLGYEWAVEAVAQQDRAP